MTNVYGYRHQVQAENNFDPLIQRDSGRPMSPRVWQSCTEIGRMGVWLFCQICKRK